MSTSTPSVALVARENMVAVLARQRQAFLGDGPPSVAVRRNRIDRLLALVLDNADTFVDAMATDFGTRPRAGTLFTEVLGMTSVIEHTRSHVPQWMWTTHLMRGATLRAAGPPRIPQDRADHRARRRRADAYRRRGDVRTSARRVAVFGGGRRHRLHQPAACTACRDWYGPDDDDFRRFVRSTRSGGVARNDFAAQMIPSAAPFGGVARSGMGAYHADCAPPHEPWATAPMIRSQASLMRSR